MASPNGIALLPKVKPGRRNALMQAVQLQDLSYEAAHAMIHDVKEGKEPEIRARAASGIAQLVKSWSLARDAVRILRGKPLPGSLRPEPKPKKPRRTKVIDVVEHNDQHGTPKESLSGEPIPKQ